MVGTLMDLARVDEEGRPRFRILENAEGELVLDAPDNPPSPHRRPLDGLECMRLAAMAPERPSLVVENGAGEFVVLVAGGPDLDRHTPLSFEDANELAGAPRPLAQFGRRDDDIVHLTPWESEDAIVEFDPDDPAFADVPVVAVADGSLRVLRGDVDERLQSLVLGRLDGVDAEPRTRFGLLTNPFGEFSLIAEGAPLEPHEDVRHQAVIRARSLMDGAASLGEAAAALRAFADQLEDARARGWRLPTPIADDHGFPERPNPP